MRPGYGLIRQESRFVMNARSSAARLMRHAGYRPLGRGKARHEGLPVVPGDQPDVNLTLNHYLKHVLTS